MTTQSLLALVFAFAQNPPPQDVVAVVSAKPLTDAQSVLIGLTDAKERQKQAEKAGAKVLLLKPGFIVVEFDDPMEVELRKTKLDLSRQLAQIDFTKDIRLGDLKEPAKTFLERQARPFFYGDSWQRGVEPFDKVPVDAWGSFQMTLTNGDKTVEGITPQWRPDRKTPPLDSIPSAQADFKTAKPEFLPPRVPGVLFHFGSRYSIRRRAELIEAYAKTRGDQAAAALVEVQAAIRALLDQHQVKTPEVGMSYSQLDPRIQRAIEMQLRSDPSFNQGDFEKFIAGAKVTMAAPTIRVLMTARTNLGDVSGVGFGIMP